MKQYLIFFIVKEATQRQLRYNKKDHNSTASIKMVVEVFEIDSHIQVFRRRIMNSDDIVPKKAGQLYINGVQGLGISAVIV